MTMYAHLRAFPSTFLAQNKFETLFDSQHIAWAAVNFPYKTLNGGLRNKLLFATWVPDTLRRDTFKETIRLKSSAVFFGESLKKAAVTDGAKHYQANHPSDLEVAAVLSKVAEFERDPVDPSSLTRLTMAST